MQGWEPTSGATPLTDISKTEQYFDLVTELTPGSSAVVQVGVKFAAGSNGDANVQIYARASGQSWPTEPFDAYRIRAQSNQLKSVPIPVDSRGVPEFRVGLKLDSLGSVNLVSGFLNIQKDEVDLTTPLV